MAAPVLPIARLRGNGATLRGGVGGPGMNWMTVYDVRNVAAVTPLWYMAGAAFVFFGLPGLYLLRPGSGARSKAAGGLLLFAVAGCAAIAALGAWHYARLRGDLAEGHFVVIDGNVTDAHNEASGRHSNLVFRVEGTKFILPEYFPRGCVIANRDEIRVATEPASPQAEAADQAYPVLWMQLQEQACRPGP
jgi:hypothetical protein